MTPTWLVPLMTLLSASTSGGVLGRALRVYSQPHAIQTLVVCIYMAAVGLTLVFMILTVYLMRLIIHGLPPGGKVLSVFLPIGPTSQSGYAIFLIGQNVKNLLPLPSHTSDFLNSTSTGVVVEVVCVCVSFLLWSLATMWIMYALLGMYSGFGQARVAFKVSFWGIIYPNVTTLSLITSVRLSLNIHFLGCLCKPYNPTRPYIRFEGLTDLRILLCSMHIGSLVELRHFVVVEIEESLSTRKYLSESRQGRGDQ